LELTRVESLVSLLDEGRIDAVDRSLPPRADVRTAAKIVVVDDEPINLMVVEKYLTTAGYAHVVVTSDARAALDLIGRENPDVLLLDIVMPGVGGLEILQRLRAEPRLARLPVLILTAVDDREVKTTALNLGATDFLTKPVDPTDLLPRIRNAISIKTYQDHLAIEAQELKLQVQRRTAELAASRLEVIHCLGRAAEFRDNDTGMHVIRVGHYAALIAQRLGLDEPQVELLQHAAPLHDLGKIGIPDAILLKQGKLDPQEFEFMKRHCEFGIRIVEESSQEEQRNRSHHALLGIEFLSASRSPTLRMAGIIALTHHEQWDGSGYPLGLRGEEIPIQARITAVADVFDALSSKRPYKPAFPLDKCFAMLEQGRGRHFDPRVLDAFLACKDDVLTIHRIYADHLPAARDPATPDPPGTARRALASTLPTEDDTIRKIVQRFVERLSEQSAAMRRAYQEGDFDHLARLAQWLQRAASALGFPALVTTAAALEVLSTERSLEAIGAAIDELATLHAAIEVPATPRV
jgi:putative two-component system response regulator